MTEEDEKREYKRYTRIHLTMTGYYAGKPLCDFNMDKQAAKERGETFAHAMYFKGMDHPDLCPTCKKIWEEE
jgi:hypothetical protein